MGQAALTVAGAVFASVANFVPPDAPTLLLNAILTLGPKGREGSPIVALEPAWRQLAKLARTDPSFLHQIDPRHMEELVAGWYAAEGFNVTLTPRSADGGKDVIAEKPGLFAVRILDQVKRYAPGHKVTADEVRAFLHVLNNDRAANIGVVSTSSDFAPMIATDTTIAPYLPTRLQLVNGAELARRLSDTAERL